MSRRGEITIECDSDDCYAEILLGALALEDDSLHDQLADAGWTQTAQGQDVCPDCVVEANPRERDDDDGMTYGDPRDEREDRRHG